MTDASTPIDRSPVRLGTGLAIVSALLAWLAVGAYSLLAVAIGAPGVALVVVGATRGARWAVTSGAAVLFAGVLVAGVFEAPPLALLAGTVLAVTAWDAGGTAIDLGEQLGRDADATRLQVVHVGSTALAGLLATGVSYGIYRAATGGQPVAALALLLVAAVMLTEALT